MEWQVIIALAVAIPVILFPAVYIWYINVGGVFAAVKKAREKRVAARASIGLNEKNQPELEYEHALIEALKNFPK